MQLPDCSPQSCAVYAECHWDVTHEENGHYTRPMLRPECNGYRVRAKHKLPPKPTPLQDRIVRALQLGPLGERELAACSDTTYSNTVRALRLLLDADKVRMLENGEYTL